MKSTALGKIIVFGKTVSV